MNLAAPWRRRRYQPRRQPVCLHLVYACNCTERVEIPDEATPTARRELLDGARRKTCVTCELRCRRERTTPAERRAQSRARMAQDFPED